MAVLKKHSRLAVVLLHFVAMVSVNGKDDCPGDMPVTANDWAKPSVFDGLSVKEITAIDSYMKSINSMNIVSLRYATPLSTYILMIERFPPPKQAVLQYLNKSQHASVPERTAKVYVVRGNASVPDIEEYKVGPLPNPNSHELLRNPKYRKPIPISGRPVLMNGVEMEQLVRLIAVTLDKMDALLRNITGGFSALTDCGNKCIEWIPSGSAYNRLRRRSMWVRLKRDLEGSFLHPLGVQLYLNIDAPDPANWTTETIWFRGKHYSNVDELMAKYRGGKLNVTTDKVPPSGEALFSSLHRRGPPVPETPRRGPKVRMPDGRRFRVDGHHISWLSWSLDYNIQTTTGPQVFDARFRGDRIVYELSFQELMVHYSGRSPAVQQQVYFDTALFLGTMIYPLIPGVDCPENAVYMDFAHYKNGQSGVTKNCACVFEHRDLVPLRRHYESDYRGSYFYAHGMMDNMLVARTAMSVGNYDYLCDFIFRQNGAIETRVSLTGFIQTTRYNGPLDAPYGFEVAENVVGSLHSHFVNIKLDMDIQGTANQFVTLNIEKEQVKDPVDSQFGITMTNFLQMVRKTEKEGAYKFNFDMPKYLLFYNEAERNKWNNPRAYRLLPVSMAKSMIPEGYLWERGASWIRYQVAVTKRSDDENSVTTPYHQMLSDIPVVSLQDYIDDNENITDQDLVAWVTLGTHHIPHTEDIPITGTTGIQLHFFLLPYNYFDEDPSMASRDNVRMTPPGKFEYYGNRQDDCEKDEDDVTTSNGRRSVPTSTVFLAIVLTIFMSVAVFY